MDTVTSNLSAGHRGQAVTSILVKVDGGQHRLRVPSWQRREMSETVGATWEKCELWSDSSQENVKVLTSLQSEDRAREGKKSHLGRVVAMSFKLASAWVTRLSELLTFTTYRATEAISQQCQVASAPPPVAVVAVL